MPRLCHAARGKKGFGRTRAVAFAVFRRPDAPQRPSEKHMPACSDGLNNSGERVRGCAAHPALPHALPCLHRQRNRPSENGFYGAAGGAQAFSDGLNGRNRVRGCAAHPTLFCPALRHCAAGGRPSENGFTRAAAAAAASRFRVRSRRRFCRVRRAAAGCRPSRG